MPESRSRWRDIDALLDRALELPTGDRLAFVQAQAESDPALAAAAAAVLGEDGPPDGFLEPGGALAGPLAADLARDDGEWGELTLERGVTVGPYRVDRQIGRGGMGEVYLARDLRLGREVALKILPRRLSADPDRLARFRREARALAAVSHPGIAAIYDVHESMGLVALVLELVEGPTLADRLSAGPLPPAQAIIIARQLIDAITAAHERGIVHRDLKPANVKVRPDGAVKVLDFGLARAASGDGLGAADEHADAPPDLLSITTLAAQPGIVLGTASYMSPEQTRGRRVDHRTDIWAFGCVLFEMLAGARAFGGDTVNDVMARVLEREPDYTRLPATTPPSLGRLIRKCLQKDVDRRLGHIGDARFDLDEAVAESPVAEAGADVDEPVTRRTLAIAAGVALLGVAGALTTWVALHRPDAAVVVTRLAVPLPVSQELVVGQLDAIALASTGRTLVYRAREGGVMRLYVRGLDAATATAIPGTENVSGHTVSPDGRWIAFGRDGKLFKASLAGGSPVAIADAPGGVAVAWAPDDTIVFASGTGHGLLRAPAAGGAITPQTTIDPVRGDQAHTWPAVSPDGETIAFTIATASRHVIAVSDRHGEGVRVLTDGRQPQFLSRDVLVFARENRLWAARLDASRALVREPVQVLEPIDRSTLNGFAHFAASADGSIVYVPERPRSGQDALVWVDRRGREQTAEVEAHGIARFALSRDGGRIALGVSEPDNRDVWVYDRTRRSLGRLTRHPALDTAPVWSPDGKQIAFRSDRDGGGIFLAAADGAGEARRLTHAGGLFHTPYTFTPDGAQLLFVEFRDYRDQNVFAVTTTTSAPRVEPVLSGAFAEVRPAISPDGRWLAYQSDESGRFEVYVRPFPDVERARWQVSTAGGASPTWRADGRELFYAQGGEVVSVTMRTRGGAIEAGVPTTLFAIDAGEDRLGALFEAAADGQRFLVRRSPPARSGLAAQLYVILNWRPSLSSAGGAR
jgi:Tol biopolymer transport system component